MISTTFYLSHSAPTTPSIHVPKNAAFSEPLIWLHGLACCNPRVLVWSPEEGRGWLWGLYESFKVVDSFPIAGLPQNKAREWVRSCELLHGNLTFIRGLGLKAKHSCCLMTEASQRHRFCLHMSCLDFTPSTTTTKTAPRHPHPWRQAMSALLHGSILYRKHLLI